MTVRPSPSLVNDLARLVARHGLDELGALVRALRDEDFLDELARSISELSKRVESRQPPKPKQRASRQSALDALRDRDPEAARYLGELQLAMLEKRALVSRSDLIGLATELAIKDPLPKDRKSAIRRIIAEAAALPDERLHELQGKIERVGSTRSESSYHNWANLIMGNSGPPEKSADE